MSKIISDTQSIAEIVIKLQEIQKKIKKNDLSISNFIKSIHTSGFQDEIYVKIKKTTEDYQKAFLPINVAMDKFEKIKSKEKAILEEMGRLKTPTTNTL